MSEYQLTKGSSVLRLLDGANIPDDPYNTDRQEYDRWLAAGGTPRPAPVYVPQVVSPRQARLALKAAGLLSQVNAMMRAADEEAQISWDYATEFRRDDPTLNALAVHLGLSSEAMDALFIQADAIT